MMNDLHCFLAICALGFSALFTSIIIPQVLKVAHKKSLFDNPDFRKIHNCLIPRLGGFAFLPAVTGTFFLIEGFGNFYAGYPATSIFTNRICILFFCMYMLFLIGLKDDLINVSYKAKFIRQIIAGFLIVATGTYICDFDSLFGIHAVHPALGWIISILIIIFIINAINLIDGIDGLAASIGLFSFICYGIYFYIYGYLAYTIICFAFMGSLGVFFLFNFFGNNEKHRKIFMGDIGALTMGVAIAFMAIALSQVNTPGYAGEHNLLAIAFTPIIVPLMDVIRVFALRISKGFNPFKPDKTHLHHLFMATGCSQHGALLGIICLIAVLIGINIPLASQININYLLGIDIIVYGILVAVLHYRKSPTQ